MLRFIRPVGTREVARVYWGKDCPNCLGEGFTGYHNAERLLQTTAEVPTWDAEQGCFPSLVHTTIPAATGKVPPDAWPTKCDHCGATPAADAVVARQFYRAFQYDSPEGVPQRGDCFYRVMGKGHFCDWDDCDGRHLIIVLPTPSYFEWDTVHRASNCSQPADRAHRCWVVEGEPPKLSSVNSPRRCHGDKRSLEVTGVFHKTLENGEWV